MIYERNQDGTYEFGSILSQELIKKINDSYIDDIKTNNILLMNYLNGKDKTSLKAFNDFNLILNIHN